MINIFRKIKKLIIPSPQRKLEIDKENNMDVYIKWDENFVPSYVRRIKSIRMHRNHYGNIQDSDYLEDECLHNRHRYSNNELFVVREGDWFGGVLSGGIVTVEEMAKKCRYFLIQIDATYPNGFRTIGFVYQNTSYPWHENEIVKIIVEQKLYQYITVENPFLIDL